MITGASNKCLRSPRAALGAGRAGRVRRSGGFTLLEVLIALAILAVSLMILVSTQTSAARMTAQADRILIGTMLAKQKLAEVELDMDNQPGFSEQDEIEDEGDFQDMFPDQYPEFHWKMEIRKLDLSGASAGGLNDLLGANEATDEQAEDAPGAPDQPDIASLVNMDEISEQLARFIREIKVTVYWEAGDEPDEVTLTTHVIKPSGPTMISPDNAEGAETGENAGTTNPGTQPFGGARGGSSGIQRKAASE